jgi:hypothetical protein
VIGKEGISYNILQIKLPDNGQQHHRKKEQANYHFELSVIHNFIVDFTERSEIRCLTTSVCHVLASSGGFSGPASCCEGRLPKQRRKSVG